MTRLLVSVRSVDEARLAMASGVDLIDLKEPTRGALGACDERVWREVSECVGGRCPLSAALGELLDFSALNGFPDDSFDYAKIGLAGCADVTDWGQRWAQALALMPRQVQAVAVVYADSTRAISPLPRDVLEAAISLGCRALLFDTYEKTHGHLFQHLGPGEVDALCRRASEAGLLTVLAGSLSGNALDTALDLRPDFVAVRGAVCQADRTGDVDPRLVAQLVSQIADRAQRTSAAN